MEETHSFKAPPWVFLVGLLFFLSRWIPGTSTPVLGSPLTDDEYEIFFAALRPEWKANKMCQLRRNEGCQSLKIKQLDEFENHGQIPEGPICADLSQTQQFESFCLFAQFRCLDQKFYAKRIECPETTSTPTETSHSPDHLETETASGHRDAVHLAQGLQALHHKGLHSSIETLLKYAFAVSGQEPEPQEGFPEASGSEEVVQAPPHPERPGHSKVWLVTASPETAGVKETEKIAEEHHLLHDVQHTMSTAVEGSLEVETTEAPEGGSQEETPGGKPKGRLMDLEKEDALLALCVGVLEDNCISSVVTKAWKRIENKTFDYGDLVCDSLGRRHTDLCPMCAFCSLKMEQCQEVSDLRRVHCDADGTYTAYINPKIASQFQDTAPKVVSPEAENLGLDVYGGLQADRWCGRLATHGCDDPCVELWLQTEYSFFQQGDFPDKICDSEKVEHPTYCAFKSHQCLEKSRGEQKVLRRGCFKNETYNVLSKEEGKAEVQRWSQKFSNFTEG